MTTNTGDGSSNQDVNHPSDRPLILVVEDVPVIHDVIELSLRALKAEYEFLGDGSAALEWLKLTIPDLVLLDLALPGTDGREILRQMRSSDRLTDVPVIVITAHGPGIEQEVLNLGASAYLDKPFLPSALRAMANELLGVN
ncbi:MAG: response regulator transcription factor [Acidimicrobiia bacterium]|nr:response regulator transcription factor [Acidimicrobiia bacterium]